MLKRGIIVGVWLILILKFQSTHSKRALQMRVFREWRSRAASEFRSSPAYRIARRHQALKRQKSSWNWKPLLPILILALLDNLDFGVNPIQMAKWGSRRLRS